MIAKRFMCLATAAGLTGIVMGIVMGAAHDFTLAPAHAHLNLVGWVMLFLAGLFYRLHPQCETALANVHFWLAAVGLVLFVPGVAGTQLNLPWGVPVAIAGSFLTAAAMAIFTVVVFRSGAAPARS